jgi:hypothetical protein
MSAFCQVKDALRGKAGDEKVVQELAEHKEVIKAAELKAAEVGRGSLGWLDSWVGNCAASRRQWPATWASMVGGEPRQQSIRQK